MTIGILRGKEETKNTTYMSLVSLKQFLETERKMTPVFQTFKRTFSGSLNLLRFVKGLLNHLSYFEGSPELCVGKSTLFYWTLFGSTFS